MIRHVPQYNNFELLKTVYAKYLSRQYILMQQNALEIIKK